MKYVKSIDEVAAYKIDRTVKIFVDGPEDGAKGISLGLCIVDPHSMTPYHCHEESEEVLYILKGCGKTIIDGVEYDLKENSSMYCPSKIMHQIVNPNPQELLFIFAYAPGGPEQIFKKKGALKK